MSQYCFSHVVFAVAIAVELVCVIVIIPAVQPVTHALHGNKQTAHMALSESHASGLITLAQYCTLNHLKHTLDNQCTLCVSYVGISHIFYTYQGPTTGY